MAPESSNSAAPPPGGVLKRRHVPVLVVMLLMGVEGVGVFVLVKAFGSAPVPVVAAHPEASAPAVEPAPTAEFAEIELADCKPSNKMSGRLILFHIRVSALVRSADRKRAEGLVQEKKARIEDGVNTVIRSAETNDLNEPGLETVKRRLKHELGRIFGDDQLITDVLIPHLLQSGSGV